MTLTDFLLTLKELQVVYGDSIHWYYEGYGMNVLVKRTNPKNNKQFFSPILFVVRFGNSRMNGKLKPDMITEIRLKSGRLVGTSGFSHYVRAIMEGTKTRS